MSNNESIADRVTNYISNSEDIEVGGMADLSSKAVAVKDNFNEIDVYFDARSYSLIMERIWRDGEGESCLFPPGLKGTGLGVLPGIGCAPQIRSYVDALEFAKQQLRPISEKDEFYDQPIELKR